MTALKNDFEFTSKVDMVKANVTESIINKGELEDNFSRGDGVLVNKKGSEIIDNLKNIILGKQLLKVDLESRIKDLKELITAAPLAEPIDEYKYRGYQAQITGMSDCLNLKYSYQCCRFTEDMDTNLVPAGSETANSYVVTKQTADMCSKYNDLVCQCIDTCAEICLATTMINNLDPSSKYPLNIQQLKSLGF